jgi:hypothetical protein
MNMDDINQELFQIILFFIVNGQNYLKITDTSYNSSQLITNNKQQNLIYTKIPFKQLSEMIMYSLTSSSWIFMNSKRHSVIMSRLLLLSSFHGWYSKSRVNIMHSFNVASYGFNKVFHMNGESSILHCVGIKIWNY